MKPGDLVRAIKSDRIGIIVEIFSDLDVNNPWIRVRWTHPHKLFEWCKPQGLVLANSDKKQRGLESPPCDGAEKSGSL